MEYILRDWCVCFRPSADPYTPPELLSSCLGGKIYGRADRFEDGNEVTTSRIVKSEGRKVTTKSGSVYVLEGPPAKSYLDFLKSIGYDYDEENPIKIKVRVDLSVN